MKNPLIIVTGGAGFIGSHVIRHLNQNNQTNILVVDDLKFSEKWKNLVGKKFYDIISKNDLFDWLKGKEDLPKSFIHLGACSSTVEQDNTYLLENNYRYTLKLAEHAVKHKNRFIYASSAATYGDGSNGFSDDESKLGVYKPLNMYGYSKHLLDLRLQSQNILDQCTGLKYFNVFGPNEAHKGRMASAVFHMVPQILKDKKVKLFQSNDSRIKHGEQSRDFVYVDDAARMTVSFLDNNHTGLFNIGSAKASTWNDLADAIFYALGIKPSIEYIPMPEDLQGKYQNYTCAEMKKTKSALGEASSTLALRDSVKEYVQNYLMKGEGA